MLDRMKLYDRENKYSIGQADRKEKRNYAVKVKKVILSVLPNKNLDVTSFLYNHTVLIFIPAGYKERISKNDVHTGYRQRTAVKYSLTLWFLPTLTLKRRQQQ